MTVLRQIIMLLQIAMLPKLQCYGKLLCLVLFHPYKVYILLYIEGIKYILHHVTCVNIPLPAKELKLPLAVRDHITRYLLLAKMASKRFKTNNLNCRYRDIIMSEITFMRK